MQQYDLAQIPTCELVKELERRDGVFVDKVMPHEDQTISINGPAIILTVVD